MRIPVALQLFSVGKELEEDPRGTLTAIKEMGYDGVEVCGCTYGMSYDEFNEFCNSIGLKVASAHYSLGTLTERGDEIYGEFSKMGMKYVAVPWMTRDGLPGGENYTETVEKFIAAGKKAHEYGMQLLYHNHAQEFEKHEGKYLLDTLFDDVGAYLLKGEYDVCWVKFAGEDPADYIEKNDFRCEIVHLKDYYAPRDRAVEHPEFRPAGYGCQDVPSILDAAEKVGAKWIIVEQDETAFGKTPMESAKMSIDYLKTIYN